MNRRNAKKVKIGDIYIGGDSKISVQSMNNTDTRDREKTIKQINIHFMGIKNIFKFLI